MISLVVVSAGLAWSPWTTVATVTFHASYQAFGSTTHVGAYKALHEEMGDGALEIFE
jgi:hypothetical protein